MKTRAKPCWGCWGVGKQIATWRDIDQNFHHTYTTCTYCNGSGSRK